MDWLGIGFVICFGVLTGRVIFGRYDTAWNLGVFTWAILELLGVMAWIGL